MPGVVILQLNRLGDLHQTLPVLRGFESHYSPEHLLLVCCDDFAEALPTGAFAGRQAVLRRATLSRWANRLRKAEAGQFPIESVHAELPEALQGDFDLAVNLTQDEPSAALMGLIHSQRKRGRIWSPAQDIVLADDWSKYLFALVKHRLANLFNLVDMQLGIAGLPFRGRQERPMLSISPEQSAHARTLLGPIQAGRTRVAVQLGASDTFRALGPRRFAQALNAVPGSHDFDAICVGSSSEHSLGEVFAQEFKGRTVNLQGKTRLEALPAVLAECRFLLSNDTGTLHVAASVGTPTLGLFFATAYYSETAPYGEGHAVLQAALPCSPCNVQQRCTVQHCRQSFYPDAIGAVVHWLLNGRSGPAPGPFESLELYVSRFTGDCTLLYEPAAGWPTPTRYLEALAWRRAFAQRLHLVDSASTASCALPVSAPQLEELALALEDVARQIESTDFTAANRSAQMALERLHQAEKACGPWGSFVGFERIADFARHAMLMRHQDLARETRAWSR
jgi:ADP-heptose:LPS heptosyltransferase